ncbi:hypothetical protein [Bradyrhizobium sp. USDA 10063]
MQHIHPDIYAHIRFIMAMVLSLSLARLLNGLATFVQHPIKVKIFWIHIGWVLSMFLFVIHLWWWEFRLREVASIDFPTYFFLLVFCSLFFFLCAVLFPTSMEEYTGYEDYFISRRGWFFGILAVLYAADLVDTAIKSPAYFASFGLEYPIRNMVYIALCLVAIVVSDKRFHGLFVALGLVYQVSWIIRSFS